MSFQNQQRITEEMFIYYSTLYVAAENEQEEKEIMRHIDALLDIYLYYKKEYERNDRKRSVD
jgi:hypothetical protein